MIAPLPVNFTVDGNRVYVADWGWVELRGSIFIYRPPESMETRVRGENLGYGEFHFFNLNGARDLKAPALRKHKSPPVPAIYQ